MSFELKAGGQSLVNAVSYTPYDSLRDLIRALCALLSEDTEMTVRWAYNPDEMDFNFKAAGGEARLEVMWYKNQLRAEGTGERVFFFEGSRLDVCRPFWEALRDMQADVEVDEFARNWRREFPAAEMRGLTEEIAAYRRKQAAEA
jgi:hypothetical protein